MALLRRELQHLYSLESRAHFGFVKDSSTGMAGMIEGWVLRPGELGSVVVEIRQPGERLPVRIEWSGLIYVMPLDA